MLKEIIREVFIIPCLFGLSIVFVTEATGLWLKIISVCMVAVFGRTFILSIVDYYINWKDSVIDDQLKQFQSLLQILKQNKE